MRNWKKKEPPAVWLSHGFYYFKVTTTEGRKTISTGATNKREAEDYRDQWCRANLDVFNPKPEQPRGMKGRPRLLGQLLDLFLIPEANPAYLNAQIDGGHYSERRATAVARHARQASEAMGPHWRSVPLSKLTRQDMITIRAAIHKAYGNTHKANDVWRSFKAILAYGAEVGYMATNPSQGMKSVRVIEGKEKITLGYMDVRRIYATPELFDNETARDLFYVLATTGLRRGEVCALQGKQLKRVMMDGEEILCLNVNQAWKDDSFTKLGRPKWDLDRVIPLAPTTARILSKYIAGREDFLFPLKPRDIAAIFGTLSARIDPEMLDRPEALETLNPHALRHSLNTVLLEEESNPILVQEYMSWHHQEESKVQQGYTHIYIRGLLKISRKIESLYSGPANAPAPLDDGVITFD